MWLLRQTQIQAVWLASLWAGVFRIALAPGLLAVVLSLIADVALILSFFLPLKIVMLAGSEGGMPWYFREVFGDADRDNLIIWLSAGTVAFYFTNLGASYFGAESVKEGAKRVLARSRKMVLFEDQDEVANRYLRQLTNVLAGVLFLILSFGAGVWLNPVAFGAIGGSLVALYLGSLLACESEGGRDWYAKHYKSFFKISSGIIFLIFFGVLLLQFLTGALTNLIYALASLLLGRQVLQRSIGLGTGVIVLSQGRAKIDALFFPGTQFFTIESRQQFSFWEYVARTDREERFRRTLSNIIRRNVSELNARWCQLGIRNVVAFEIVCTTSEGEQRYFMKHFGPGRGARAQHEASLLGERWSLGLPAPRMLGLVAQPHFQALVFEGFDGSPPEAKDVNNAQQSVLQAAWRVRPPEDVVDRFQRSKPLLAERIGDKLLSRLSDVVYTDEQAKSLGDFRSALPELLEMVEALPLHVRIPPPSRDQLVICPNGEFIALDWSSWTLEPIGAGWPVSRDSLEEIPGLLAEAASDRHELARVDESHARAAALLYQFEQVCHQQLYVNALDMLPDIVEIGRNGTLPVRAVQ